MSEQHNQTIYKVGGAVRDKLLNYPWSDTDWVVTGSSPQQMLNQKFTPVGKDFPVFLHPKSKEEYALARTERKSAPGYQGFTFNTDPSITIEQDLARRDLTINSIAQTDQGELIDPFNGAQDIKDKILRHTSSAFIEDPVRVLRLARFKARYHHLGFEIAVETRELVAQMKINGELDALVPERVWQELQKALLEKNPEQFFYALQECRVLDCLFPEIHALFDVPQTEKYHPEIDTGIHLMMVLQKSAQYNFDLPTRFAALTHDFGKALTPEHILPSHHGHERKGLKPVKNFCNRLKIPKQLTQIGLLCCEYHTHIHRAFELKASTLVDLFYSLGAFRNTEQFQQITQACLCDYQGRLGLEDKPYPQKEYVENMLEICQSVDKQAIIQQGFEGKEISEQIRIAQIKLVKNNPKESPQL